MGKWGVTEYGGERERCEMGGREMGKSGER